MAGRIPNHFIYLVFFQQQIDCSVSAPNGSPPNVDGLSAFGLMAKVIRGRVATGTIGGDITAGGAAGVGGRSSVAAGGDTTAGGSIFAAVGDIAGVGGRSSIAVGGGTIPRSISNVSHSPKPGSVISTDCNGDIICPANTGTGPRTGTGGTTFSSCVLDRRGRFWGIMSNGWGSKTLGSRRGSGGRTRPCPLPVCKIMYLSLVYFAMSRSSSSGL